MTEPPHDRDGAVANSEQPLYVVAEIRDNGRLGIDLGKWTHEVFTDRDEALSELADAHDAGLTAHRVYRLQPCHPPIPPLPRGGL